MMRFLFIVFVLLHVNFVRTQALMLAFRGVVTNQELGKNEGGVNVAVLQNGSTIASSTTATNGKYSLKFNVDKNAPFVIVFSKEGMVSKRINFSFSSMNPEDISAGVEFAPLSDLSMAIFSNKENIDFSFLNNEPVANFNWSSSKAALDLDRVAAEKMKARIEKLLMQSEQNNNANEVKYQALIKEADQLYLNLKKYPEALDSYEKALVLKPKEKYPSDKIVELDALIAANKQQAEASQKLDAEYQNLIHAGDVLRDQKKFDQAIVKYKEAITKKNEQYPKDQMVMVQKMLDEQKVQAELDAKYNEVLKDAEIAFVQKKFILAKEKYTAAKGMKPSESIPAMRLAEIEKKLNEQAALDEKKKKYEDAIIKGDQFFTEGKWSEAKAKYSEAASIDPEAMIPPNKIKECDLKLLSAAKEKEKTERISKTTAEGEAYFSAGKFNEARGKFNEVLTMDPANVLAKQKIQEIEVKQQEASKQAEQEAKFLKSVSEGDLASKNLKYTEAKLKYEEALKVKSEPSVQQKLDEIIKKLKAQEDQASKDVKFQQLKTEGLKLANEQKYEDAKVKLIEAQSIKADAVIAAKLKEIEEIQKLNDTAKRVDKEYQELLTTAQRLESDKNYTEAIQKYKEASSIKPTEKLPKEKITSLEMLRLGELKQKDTETKYNAFMSKGDDYMSQQKYLDAIKEYNQALNLKPTEKLPVEKAKQAEEAERNKGSEDKKQYEKIISGIEKAISEREYSRGKELVERAKGLNKQFNIVPSDTRPADLLAKINLLEQSDKYYAAKMAEAEKWTSAKEYTKAIAAYEAAKSIKPSEQLPQTKINELKKLMDDASAALGKEQLYSDYMSKGEFSEKAKNYLQALEFYQKALDVKVDDPLAKQKIAALKQLMEALNQSAKTTQEKKEKFDALLTQADDLFKSAAYMEAVVKYTEALSLDPSNKYVKKQLEECNRKKLSAETLKIEEDFKRTIKGGDEAFGAKSFDKAAEFYRQALELKPGNPYAVNKLKETEALLSPSMEKTVSLAPLGKPFESSIMDGYAALQEAEVKRKGNKEQAVGSKVTEAARTSENLEQIQLIKNQSNRDKVSSVVEQVSTDNQIAAQNRQSTILDVQKTQSEVAGIESTEQEFKYAENLKINEELNAIHLVAILNNTRFQSEMNGNNEIFQAKQSVHYDDLSSKELKDNATNVQSAQRILLVQKEIELETKDDFESRLVIYKQVDLKIADLQKTENTINTEKRKALVANNEQLMNTSVDLMEKELQDTKVPGKNNDFMKEVQKNVNEKDQFIVNEKTANTADLDRKISEINATIDESTKDRDVNRLASSERMHLGNQMVEALNVSSNRKENTKYLSNQGIIDDRGAIKATIELKADENLNQNALAVQLLDKKSNEIAGNIHLSDDDERLSLRTKVETVSGNVQDRQSNDYNDQTAANQKMEAVSKAIDAENVDLSSSNKNKYLSNQEKISSVETNVKSKAKLANSLGKEYPEGVSQESFTQNDDKGLVTAVITRRIVVKEGHGDVYVRTQTLQTITFTKNGLPTTEMVWQRETQGSHLKKNY